VIYNAIGKEFGFMRKLSARTASLLFLILVVPSFSQPSGPSSGPAPEAITSDSLLQRAHAMLPALSPSERLAVLMKLVNTSKKHPEVSSVWMDEAFAAASHVSDRHKRIDSLISLLYFLTSFDTEAALEKLAIFEPPLHQGDYDPREGAATWTFDRFYRDHPAEVERIITVARHIGNTGSYPFGGVSNVISEMAVRNANRQPISGEKQEAVAVLVQDAVRYFRESPPSNYLDEKFADFLRSYSQFVPPELLKPVLQELVVRLVQPPQVGGNKLITMVPDKGEAPPIITRNRNDVLLAELMPLVRSVDPAWEQKLRQVPDVNRLAERISNGSGLAILGAYSNGDSDERTIQRLQMDRARMLAREQPEKATKVLAEVSDPAMNAATAASLAMTMKDSRPDESAQLLARAQQALEKTKAPQDRMVILLELTRALASMKQPEQLAVMVDQSFRAADEIISAFAARYPDSPSMGRAAPWQLAGIAEISAKLIPEHMLARINDVRVPALQADLLIAMAHGLDSEEYQAKPESALKAAQSKK
jgi:hypothetical protein